MMVAEIGQKKPEKGFFLEVVKYENPPRSTHVAVSLSPKNKFQKGQKLKLHDVSLREPKSNYHHIQQEGAKEH